MNTIIYMPFITVYCNKLKNMVQFKKKKKKKKRVKKVLFPIENIEIIKNRKGIIYERKSE